MNRLLLLLALLLSTWSSSSSAHPQHASAIRLALHDDVVSLRLLLPLDQLALALPVSTSVSTAPAAVLARDGGRFAAYAQQSTSLTTPDGRAFSLVLNREALHVDRVDDADQLVVDLVATPPPGASTRAFTLRDTAILDHVDSHRVYVELRSDFAAGILEDTALIGVLAPGRDSVVVDRGEGDVGAGFRAVFLLGLHHIADGTDHLLFLLVLLLPASLTARGGRWRSSSSSWSSSPTRSATRQIVGVVTAFTLGHSITLAVATLQVVTVPSQLVETVIALSILVSALHAIRPVFAGREAAVAAVFGLVHGLAFATVLAELGVRGTSLAVSLLAFNLGIEAMQLVIILVTMPWLVLLSRTRIGGVVRVVVAVIAGVAAVAWAIERIFDTTTAVTAVVEDIAARAPWVLVLLASTSIAATLLERRRAR